METWRSELEWIMHRMEGEEEEEITNFAAGGFIYTNNKYC